MSTCISSHGEYDAHETDPDTFVCKWCHEFDERGALAEIARLRGGPVTGMEHTIEHAAQVLIRHPLGQPQGGTASGAFVLCGCGTVINGTSRDHAHAQAKKHVARALAAAGLLTPAPLRLEWGSEMRDARPGSSSYVLYARDPDHARWQIEHNPDHATGRVMHRYRTDWLPVDRAEGDGSVDQ